MSANERRPAGAPSEILTKGSTESVAQPADVHEPSAWLRSTAAQQVRAIKAAALDSLGMVIAPLGSSGAPGSRADRSCDRCGRFVPEGDVLHLLTYHVSARIILAGGMCSSCAAKEGMR